MDEGNNRRHVQERRSKPSRIAIVDGRGWVQFMQIIAMVNCAARFPLALRATYDDRNV